MDLRELLSRLDRRPVILALAGPNGAGKTTFFFAHLRQAGLRFVNADMLTGELDLDPYAGARLADALRRELLAQSESFIFETVFSDPVGDKIRFLKEAEDAGYTVLLCHIGIESAEMSEQRVCMRVSQGGHDVPTEKLVERLPRTIRNLDAATRDLPHVMVFDNSDLSWPYRLVAVFENGELVQKVDAIPEWLEAVLGHDAPE
jgi:predicted ABC-type ATPase